MVRRAMLLSVLLLLASFLLSNGQSGNKPQVPTIACNTPDVLKGLGKSETLVHTYRVTVRLVEPVAVRRNDKNNKNDKPMSVIGATTWEKSQAGSVDEDKWADILQDKVLDFVDQFCNDYLKANPKS